MEKRKDQRCRPSKKSTRDRLKLLREEQMEEAIVEDLLGLKLSTLETQKESCDECWGMTCSHDFGGWN